MTGQPGHETLRIVVTRGGRRLLLTEPLHVWPERIRLRTITYSPTRVLDGRQVAVLRRQHAGHPTRREEGFDEALFVTPHGRVLEAPTSSIFWVKDGEVLTPPLDEHILASITRAAVIDVTRGRGARLHARWSCSSPTRRSWPRRPARCSRWGRSTSARSTARDRHEQRRRSAMNARIESELTGD